MKPSEYGSDRAGGSSDNHLHDESEGRVTKDGRWVRKFQARFQARIKGLG